jgi:hypothetical protein
LRDTWNISIDALAKWRTTDENGFDGRNLDGNWWMTGRCGGRSLSDFFDM